MFVIVRVILNNLGLIVVIIIIALVSLLLSLFVHSR
jgi:hypothetical protein